MIKFEDLTVGQKDAFNKALECIGTKKHITIRGPAGTGKTTLMKFLLDELYKRGTNGIILTAPTHQAKKELAKAAGRPANTIHRIFKINPVTLEENYIFEQRELPDMSKCRVLVVDECSMPGRKLFDIIMNSVPSYCTIIAVGDHAQLRPVEVEGTESGGAALSPFFTDPRFTQVELTEVRRQGENSPIIQVATDIRNGRWIYPCVRDGEGVHQHQDLRSFMVEYFRKVKSQDDFMGNRCLAYTNKTTDKLIQIIRKQVLKTEVPFIPDEVLVLQEPLMVEVSFGGKRMQEIIFNNGQLVRVLRTEERVTNIKARGMEDSVDIKHFRLEVESYDDENDDYAKAWINVITDQHELDKFFMYQARTATAYKSGEVKAYWKDFWKNKYEFIRVRSLPAQTIHKSQGSTIDNGFLFTGCIHSADAELAQQLLYVGVTRPRHNLHYI